MSRLGVYCICVALASTGLAGDEAGPATDFDLSADLEGLSAGQAPLPYPRLEAILREAASESPTMVQSHLRVAQQDASRYRGWWTYVPEINMNYNVGVFHEIRESIDDDEATRFAAEYTIRADQPLYYWGAWEARRELAFTEEDLAEEDSFLTYANLVNELRSAYVGLVSDRAQLRWLRLRAENARRRVRELTLLEEQGRARASEVEAAELQRQSHLLEAERFALELEQRFNAFRRRSGALELKLEQLPETLTVPALDVEAMRARLEAFREAGFLESTPARQAELRQEAIGHELTIQRARKRPLFNIGAAMRQGPEESATGTYELQTILFAGITGRWNLFDRRETQETIRSLRIRRRLVDAELAVDRDRRFAGAANALESIRFGLDSIDLRERLVAARRAELKQVEARLEGGSADRGDVQQANEKLNESELSLIKEKGRLLTAYYAFLGALLEDPALAYYQKTPQFETGFRD